MRCDAMRCDVMHGSLSRASCECNPVPVPVPVPVPKCLHVPVGHLPLLSKLHASAVDSWAVPEPGRLDDPYHLIVAI